MTRAEFQPSSIDFLSPRGSTNHQSANSMMHMPIQCLLHVSDGSLVIIPPAGEQKMFSQGEMRIETISETIIKTFPEDTRV